MKKKIIIISILIIIIILAVMQFFMYKKDPIDTTTPIKIQEYDQTGVRLQNEIEITKTKEITLINEEIRKMEESKSPKVNTEVIRQIDIHSKNVTIGIEKGEKKYCWYLNEETDEIGFKKLSKRLYNFIMKKIEE